ncbi:unnamed protein product [marine sediment metagenome]|uniref:Uncharacterized protein n=1 Tax=marine sediment metagenome TaxID=412755 RepID=X1ML88_9ZZZZ
MVGKVFIKTTCPLCGREAHPKEFRMNEDFGEFRLKSSLGHYGMRTEVSTPLLDAIQSSEDARRVFDWVRKNIIGLFNRLWDLKLATADDLNQNLRVIVRGAESIRLELEGSKILKVADYRRLLFEIEQRGLLNLDLKRQNEKLKRELDTLIIEAG